MFDDALAAARRYFTGLYFYPDADDFGTPASHNVDYEDVHFRSGSSLLHGFLMRAVGPSKGFILHCHGNAGNVTVHFPLVTFLVRAGYDVLSFDYAGYGRSEGAPTLAGIGADARAALDYALSRKDLPVDRVAVFGQSLGGAAAAAAAAHPAVKCLILEATFTTFREVATTTLIGRALFFIVQTVIPEGGPAESLPAFGNRPVLLVHGDHDRVVPERFSRRLHDLFPSNTELHIVPDVGHLTTIGDKTSPFGGAILSFLARRLGA